MNLRYLEGIKDAAGVRGGLTDFYNMLQTGLVDAGMLWPEAAATFKISEVAPYMLRAVGSARSVLPNVNLRSACTDGEFLFFISGKKLLPSKPRHWWSTQVLCGAAPVA